MKLSEMRDLLSTRGIQLTKSLGQNFLHDTNQLERIVRLAQVQPGDQVLEIGPGLGPLTEELLKAGATVFAIEKDQRLVTVLNERFTDPKTFTLLHADALEFLKRDRRDWSDWMLVANLPYSVASPILVEFALLPSPPKRVVVTLQLEVAARLMAKSGDDDYGQLSLFVQLQYEPKEWFKIPAGSFFPPPDVDSACIRLDRRHQPLLPPELTPKFFRIVKRAFSERRKMMFKLLKTEWPTERLHAAFESLSISPQIRAEALPLETFVALTKALSTQ
jgi:16S rRNA (adenine1518-N6/adenine1519-N6)-dimethyltransferase